MLLEVTNSYKEKLGTIRDYRINSSETREVTYTVADLDGFLGFRQKPPFNLA